MTMPHLMNCSHSETGWCLDCVKAQHESLILATQESIDHQHTIAKLADGIRQIYAERGEDQLIHKICDPLIQMSRLYADGDSL